MIALILCIIALPVCFFAGRRSLGWGLVAMFFFGYLYGILRANLITTFSHFIYDAGLIGLYCSQRWSSPDPVEQRRLKAIRLWVGVLVVWPLLVVLLPFQPLMVSLVGLRGNMFFVPLVLLGAMLQDRDLRQLSRGLAVFNLVALAFAVAEYFRGIPSFYPMSAVTSTIYGSGDVAGGYYRIPAIFTSAHAFGGTMVGSLPFLVGLWSGAAGRWAKLLAILGISAALLGVLMSATRQNFVIGVVIVTVTLISTKMKSSARFALLTLVAIMGLVAMVNPRFQRFKTLGDKEAVAERVGGSVNMNFLEILVQHPMGNGLGGGGSSMPYFLEGQIRNPIGIENEYARILAEQGVIGFLLWIAFVFWFLGRLPTAFARGPWANSRKIVWCLTAFELVTAFIGLGLFTSIPGTALTMLGIGWTSVPMAATVATRRRVAGYVYAEPRTPGMAPVYRSSLGAGVQRPTHSQIGNS